MEMYMYCLLFAALFAVGDFESPNRRKLGCIHTKFTNDIGNDGYTDCYTRNRDLETPKIKQCLGNWMKKHNIIKTASTGQMTVDVTAFATKAREIRDKNTGRAMEACKNLPNNDIMYREAARASQCVFEEIKKTCP